MFKFLRAKWLQSKVLAIGWLLLMSVLFFLPGSALPKENVFTLPHLDKLVHAGFFAVLVFLWVSAFRPQVPKFAWLLILMAIIYGLLVEYIQREWVPNRSFDLYDVLADAAGSFIGYLVWLMVYRKK